MNAEFIRYLSEAIALPQDAVSVAQKSMQQNAASLAQMCGKTEAENLKICQRALQKNRADGAAFCLAFCISFAEETHRRYQQKQLPEKIFLSSMQDITVWTRAARAEEQIDGLTQISWLMQTLYMHLFRIGRLQFQFFQVHYFAAGLRLSDFKKTPFPNHSRVLNIHIPAGEALNLSQCQQSLQEAEIFFSTYYPEYIYRGFVCDSWLLDPKNTSFMAPNSNILQFATLFSPILESKFQNHEIVKRLWGEKAVHQKYSTLPTTTSLQKQTKEYLLQGGKTGNGYGFIALAK